jgi:hypothetical protein
MGDVLYVVILLEVSCHASSGVIILFWILTVTNIDESLGV